MKKSKVGHVTSFGGPFAVMRMPVKGYVTAGGAGSAAYYETADEMSKAYLELCVSDPGSNEADLFAAAVFKCVTVSGWAKVANKDSITERPLAFSTMRLTNAFLCTYGEGLIVCKSIEGVAILLDEFLEFRYPAKATPFGQLTREEIAEMLKDQEPAAAAAEAPSPTP